MAERPIFVPDAHANPPLRVTSVTFKWHAGLSVAQKQRSIAALHASARDDLGISRILEISSKSPELLGRSLSAFNLMVECPDSTKRPLETVFQAAKVFSGGGPYLDILNATPREAKRDERLKSGGRLVHFEHFGRVWPSQPTTSFYDWLYCRGVLADPGLARLIQEYEAFTDIEFNPKKSLNCQASSAALLLALLRQGIAEDVTSSPERFLALYSGAKSAHQQSELF